MLMVRANLDSSSLTGGETIAKRTFKLNRTHFMRRLEKLQKANSILEFQLELSKLREDLLEPKRALDLFQSEPFDEITYQSASLFSQIEQMTGSKTLLRGQYYLARLKKSLSQKRYAPYSDIDLNRWQEYEDVITDSLWLFDKRDSSGAHLGWYWGNFVPQIPRQLMIRYTKKGEWVLDPFLGSGTTLIECRRLRRNGVGVELNHEVADAARKLIDKEPNENGMKTNVLVGDSKEIDYRSILAREGIKSFQLAVLHPPYYDIIKFSNLKEDLSNSSSVKEFLSGFGEVIRNLTPYLDKGRFLVVVIGDKYQQGEWIPLGFYCMEEVKKHDYCLKGIVVKNFEETRSKRNQKELWRYRALAGGFYIFKHEYILIFKKEKHL